MVEHLLHSMEMFRTTTVTAKSRVIDRNDEERTSHVVNVFEDHFGQLKINLNVLWLHSQTFFQDQIGTKRLT